jgi:sialate O-acetylesterase
MICIGKRQTALSLFIVLALSCVVSADIRLPAIIGDNMVLQRGLRATIWGWADAGEKVTAAGSWGGKAETTAGEDGKWMVKVDLPAATGPFEITIAGKNTITLKNVLVGEVWVCSGQSNMEWPLRQAADANAEISAANYPQIRHFTVQKRVSDKPESDCAGKWLVCSPRTAWGFSAVGYFFGRDLHKQLDAPIGLIHTSWGGTPAEAWTSRDFLERDGDFKPILERYEEAIVKYPVLKEKYEQEMKRAEEEAAKLKAEGQKVPRRPRIEPPIGPGNSNSPTGLYNGMLAPLMPYGIRGAIWYQGEANADRAHQYRKLFPAMIKCWRDKWGQGDFPFLYVQLANYMAVNPEPADSEWAELREAQLMTLAQPNTGMAVIIDIGEANNIHPRNKQDVGRRLALWALAKTYGRDVVYSGPTYQLMAVEGNKAVLHFQHVGGGLVAKGGEPLKGFAIAGADHKFVWADAKIEGDTVVVSSPQVAEPVAVRYAWANNPVCNLYNKEGLPASPFRADDLPGLTINKK